MTGKALEVLTNIQIADINKYEKVKFALLTAFACNADGCHRELRMMEPQKDECFETYIGRMTRMYDRWLELSNVNKYLIDFT